MHIYLLISKNDKAKVPDILAEYSKQEFPVNSISEARDLISYIKNGFANKTAIVIRNFEEISVEAQNTLLKTFEEPPQNTAFVVFAKSEQGIPETILSRAFVNYLPEVEDLFENTALEFLKGNAPMQLKITNEIKTRDEALGFTESLLKNSLSLKPELASAISETHSALKKNGNVALQLINLVIKAGNNV